MTYKTYKTNNKRRAAGPAVLFAVALGLSACGEAIEEITPPSPFHGIHGMAFDAEGRLLAGSVLGGAIYEVDIDRGTARTWQGAPEGMADDIALGPNGQLAWTAFLDGKVYVKDTDGEPRIVAEGLIGANSIAYAPDGRLFMTQVFAGDALYELDPTGVKKPRKIMEDMGGLNGFEFGEDGYLYGPLWFKKRVVRVDVDRARLRTIARGFGIPAAVNFGPDGYLYVVDTKRGEVVRVNPKNGFKKVIARGKSAIDNLAFNKEGRLFISNMADNAIIEVNLEDGSLNTIISGVLAAPGDIAVGGRGEKERIYVADIFALRAVDPKTGEVHEITRMFAKRKKKEIDYPTHISVDNKHILLTGWSAGSVQVIDRRSEESLALLHDFAAPHDAVMLPDGSLIVAEYAKGELTRVSGRKWRRRRSFIKGLEGPVALLLGEDGNLYVSEYTAGRITRIDPKSRRREVIITGLDKPEGFDQTPDGRFIIAETGKTRIVAARAGKDYIDVLADNLPIGLNALPSVESPYAITGVGVGSDGTIYFSSDLNSAIYKISQ